MYISFRPVALFEPTAYAARIGFWYVLVLLLLLLLWALCRLCLRKKQVLNAHRSVVLFVQSRMVSNEQRFCKHGSRQKKVCLHHGEE